MDLPWIKNGKNEEYINHGRWMFKKRQVGENTIYLIYEHETIMFNTNMYFDFLKRYKAIITKDQITPGLPLRY